MPGAVALTCISQYDADHVEEMFDPRNTWFGAQMMRLIAKADRENKERLRLAFPHAVAAYERWFNGPGPGGTTLPGGSRSEAAGWDAAQRQGELLEKLDREGGDTTREPEELDAADARVSALKAGKKVKL